jgi:pyruvate-formate lyase-activating enzyme
MHIKLLFSTPDGTVLEHPYLHALVRSADDIIFPHERPLSVPAHCRLVSLPGRRPLGWNPSTKQVERLETVRVEGNLIYPQAVAATLPPGYTRTFLPASDSGNFPPLSQWAYTAVGWSPARQQHVFWAMRTDPRNHWNPDRFSTPKLPSLVKARLSLHPNNGLLRQLRKCALQYCCFTAQNIFYLRDEGGLPSSTGCNAQCLGCISHTQPGGSVSSMERLTEAPNAQEIAEVGAHHLIHARGRVMVSYGQGCEGEPLTRVSTLVPATRLMRQRTSRGTIHINTNASLPYALEELLGAGVGSIRVSLNSAHPELYHAYYRPSGYTFSDVETSLQLAQKNSTFIALNLLMFPGITDRAGEVKALIDLIGRYQIHQLQTRSLCIDTDSYTSLAKKCGAQGRPMGISNMIELIKRKTPWIRIGNFSLADNERS